MTFTKEVRSMNLPSLMRKLGYRPIATTPAGELNCVRPLAGQDYPRFHIYATANGRRVQFSLHLDQKRPSYEGTSAHSGDYDSETVRGEQERIERIIVREEES